jgi:putative transcriptional regulator
VACHASLCPHCAREVARFEATGGALLAAELGDGPSGDLLARTLAQLSHVAPVVPHAAPRDPILPAALRDLIGPFDALRWVKSLPNTWTVEFTLAEGALPIRLRRFLPGTHIPMHGHRAPEYDLVLAGGLSDDRDGRSFERGDVASADKGDTHSLTIADGEECVALSVHAARVRPVGLFARLIFAYTGW